MLAEYQEGRWGSLLGHEAMSLALAGPQACPSVLETVVSKVGSKQAFVIPVGHYTT